MDVTELTGKTLTTIENTGDELVFTTDTGDRYKLYHEQDCCENVSIEDVIGDLGDLVGAPLLMAEEVSGADEPPPADGYAPESYTWTFYKFATTKGYVTVRWYGESNGYYSEDVDFAKF
jgi:hypothetical protein